MVQWVLTLVGAMAESVSAISLDVHPNPAGYRVIGEFVDLALFTGAIGKQLTK